MPPSGAAPGPPLGRDFTRFWSAGALTSLGAATSTFAVPLLVLSLGGSPAQAGLVATTAALAAAAVHLPAGAMADRVDRRRLLLSAHALRLALVSALTVSVATHTVTVAVVLAVATATAALTAATASAEHAAIAQLVRPGQLMRAYARNEARVTAAALAGPPLGGVLYATSRAAPFAADAVGHVVSLLLLRSVRTPLVARSACGDDRPELVRTTRRGRVGRRRSGLVKDVGAGMEHVVRTPFLRAVILITAPANAALAALTFTSTIALRQAGTPASTVGAALGVLGLGALVGALAAPQLVQRLKLRTLLVATTASLLAGAALTSALTGGLLMTVPLALGYLLTPAINTALLAEFASTTPHHLQGRVLSVIYLASGAVAGSAPAAAGHLIDAHGPTAASAAAAALLVLPLVTALSSQGRKTRA